MVLAELIVATSSPLWMTVFAIGNIKRYQLWICGINLSVIPISWIVLSIGLAPYWILVYRILVSLIVLIYRVEYLNIKMGFPKWRYYKQIVLRLLIFVPLLTIPELYWISHQFEGWTKIIVMTFISVIIVSV